MWNIIYKRAEFIIIKEKNNYIAYNTLKPFETGHSHFEKYNTCISAIKCVQRKELPRNHSKWFLTSLLRLNSDKGYKIKIENLMIDFKRMMESNNEVDKDRCY